jgi:hypothetical protein
MAERHDTAMFLCISYSRNTDVRRNQAITSVVASEGDGRTSSENESVRDVGARWVQHMLEIRLETEPWSEHDLIGCLDTIS